jgi:branched-subunit amino acid aminotransferase/4-amino-4-deoxychorismate lyase
MQHPNLSLSLGVRTMSSFSVDKCNLVYVNGEYLPDRDAKVSVYDRGLLFSDGVYEVSVVLSGAMIDNGPHLRRLQRSLSELSIARPVTPLKEIEHIQKELIWQNQVIEGLVDLQVTGGAVVGQRGFHFPLRLLKYDGERTSATSRRLHPKYEHRF